MDRLDKAKPSIFSINPIALAVRQPVVAIEIGFYVLHCAAHWQKRALRAPWTGTRRIGPSCHDCSSLEEDRSIFGYEDASLIGALRDSACGFPEGQRASTPASSRTVDPRACRCRLDPDPVLGLGQLQHRR